MVKFSSSIFFSATSFSNSACSFSNSDFAFTEASSAIFNILAIRPSRSTFFAFTSLAFSNWLANVCSCSFSFSNSVKSSWFLAIAASFKRCSSLSLSSISSETDSTWRSVTLGTSTGDDFSFSTSKWTVGIAGIFGIVILTADNSWPSFATEGVTTLPTIAIFSALLAFTSEATFSAFSLNSAIASSDSSLTFSSVAVTFLTSSASSFTLASATTFSAFSLNLAIVSSASSLTFASSLALAATFAASSFAFSRANRASRSFSESIAASFRSLSIFLHACCSCIACCTEEVTFSSTSSCPFFSPSVKRNIINIKINAIIAVCTICHLHNFWLHYR